MKALLPDRWEVMVVLLVTSFVLVALDRWREGFPVWDEVTVLYSLLATAITLLILKELKIIQ